MESMTISGMLALSPSPKFPPFSQFNDSIKFRNSKTTVNLTKKTNSYIPISKRCFREKIEFDTRKSVNLEFSVEQLGEDISLLSTIVKEYVENGLYDEAVSTYLKILDFGFSIDRFASFPCLIKALGEISSLENNKQIHGHVFKIGALRNIHVANSLLSVYWKRGAIQDALKLFGKMPERDPVSWNTMISGFERFLQPFKSLEMFRQMIESGVLPTRISCLPALSASASCNLLFHGREIHCFIIKHISDFDSYLVSGTIDMYMKCGSQTFAQRIFEKALVRNNTVIWNVMISGYVCNGYPLKAMLIFKEMLEFGVSPTAPTMVSVLLSCSHLVHIEFGRQIHAQIFINGLQNDPRTETSLLDLYNKCGDIKASLKLFEKSFSPSFVTWGTIITGCAQNGLSSKALLLFSEFNLQFQADSCALLAAIRACSALHLKKKGMEIHGFSIKLGFDSDALLGSALTDLYAKCGNIKYAKKVFLQLSTRDVISWNALISGLSQNGYVVDVLKMIRNMQFQQVRVNAVTIASLLTVCAQFSLSLVCKQTHGYSIRNGFCSNILVNNSLLGAYSRCGNIKNAMLCFNSMPQKDIISWNSMISGFALHGCIDDALKLFDAMKMSRIKPDHVTFTSILFACSHVGKIDEGWKCLKSMVEEYGIIPTLEQYGCVVDILGRAGHLDEAYNLIINMPFEPDVSIWGSLLGSCKIHRNEQLADIVANCIFSLDPKSVGYHVLLSNIYKDSNRCDEVAKIRDNINGMGLRKSPGCSWIEVNDVVHTFTASDKSHYRSRDIYATITNLSQEMMKDALQTYL